MLMLWTQGKVPAPWRRMTAAKVEDGRGNSEGRTLRPADGLDVGGKKKTMTSSFSLNS